MTYVESGDIVFLTSDGISDNFDPVVGKFCVPKRTDRPGRIFSFFFYILLCMLLHRKLFSSDSQNDGTLQHAKYSTDLGSSIETFNVHMLLLKNLQFLPNDYETRSKSSSHECLILTKFYNHWVKIVDFFKKRHMHYESLNWGAQVCRSGISCGFLRSGFLKKPLN